jgi:RNA-directed DNA polymerase
VQAVSEVSRGRISSETDEGPNEQESSIIRAIDKVMHQKSSISAPTAKVRGEAARVAAGDETGAVSAEAKNSGTALLEAALTRENMVKAWKRVKANKGSAGVDGRSIMDTQAWLKSHWPQMKESILSGSYRPAPVRRVMIPKPDGTERQLGIPTVLDRVIQQALLQVLQPQIDPSFSEHSYGFRPGRSAYQAVLKAQHYVQSGRIFVVDVDLEKFFDRVNHDVLMSRLEKRIGDRRVLNLIRRYLQAGMYVGGLVMDRHEGTPQGGPLSPLLANVLLDEVDQALDKRGHRFVRYADDCNVYVRSQQAGERVLAGLRALYGKLRLKLNEAKSAVAKATERQFLGFSFYRYKGQVKRRVAPKALLAYKGRIRQLTRRSGGKSIEQVVEQLRAYQLGWKNYFRLSESRRVFRELDEWLRHRLRVIHLKHWKRGQTAYAALIALKASPDDAAKVAQNMRCWWVNGMRRLNRALPISYFDRLGVVKLS